MCLRFKKPPVFVTLCMALGVIILCALGFWQVQRLHEKQEILAAIDAEYTSDWPPLLSSKEMDEEFIFRRGRIKGHYLPRTDVIVGLGENMALYQAFELQSGRVIMVNRGAGGKANRSKRIMTLIGFVRPYPRGNFVTPENDLEAKLWLFPRHSDFAQMLKRPDLKPAVFYPETVHERPMLANNHLAYALFWFAMASAMIAVFLLRFVVERKL